MAYVEWETQGTELVNRNCSWECFCQFGSLPTHGDCRAHCFVQIERGISEMPPWTDCDGARCTNGRVPSTTATAGCSRSSMSGPTPHSARSDSAIKLAFDGTHAASRPDPLEYARRSPPCGLNHDPGRASSGRAAVGRARARRRGAVVLGLAGTGSA